MANHVTDRRQFLKATGVLAAGCGISGGLAMADQPAAKGKGAPHADKLGWRLGCQAWTFNDMSFFEAIAKTSSLGLHYIEGFPNQKLERNGSERLNHKLSADGRKEVKKRLADNGLKLVNFGVVNADVIHPNKQGKEVFDFAKDMGIETIVCEPSFDAFDGLEKLCDEYQINLALHDHPKPAPYWNPDTVLKVCNGRSKRIGACCDTGHWMRSDIKPIDALKKLEGRIISFHLKDLNEYGKAHDVPWGTGRADVRGILTQVHRQGVKPVFSVEYEYNYGHSMPEITECVAFFDKVCEELGKS
jgi:sugar phosphate isomerase/epimerase